MSLDSRGLGIVLFDFPIYVGFDCNSVQKGNITYLFVTNSLIKRCYPYFRNTTRGTFAPMTWISPDREVACWLSPKTIEMAHRPLLSMAQARGLQTDGPWAASPEDASSRG